MNNINLLPRKTISKEHSRILRILRTGAVSISIVVGVFAVLLFTARFDTTLAQQKKKQEELTSAFNQLQSRAVKVLLLENRLTTISTIISSRSSYESVIMQLTSLFPASIKVEQFTVKEKSLSMVLSAPSLSSLTTVSDTLSGLVEKKQLLQSVSIDSIIVENGKNSLTIKATVL